MSRVPNRVQEHKNVNIQEIKDNQNYKIYSDKNGRYAPKAVKGKQDPFWYAFDATAVANMASFPWTEIVGSPISQTKTDVLPGIAIYRYIPTVGSFQSNDNVNLLDRTATAFFNYTVQGFTGGVDFQASDLLMSEVAAASLFSALIEGKRAYGILSYYLQLNKYYAKHVCEALGFNFEDLTANLANFRMRWNMRAQEFNKTVPLAKSFAISDRWDYINSFIFTDTSSPEYSTASAYVPSAYLKYDPTSAKTGTCLRWQLKPSHLLTVDQYFDMIEELFQALNDDDVRSMFGAVRRVYDAGNFKVLNEIEVGFVTPVVQNDVIAGTLHNMYWFDREQFYFASLLPADVATDGAEDPNVACYQDNSGRILSLPVVAASSPHDTHENNVLYYLSKKQEYLFDCYDTLNTPSNVLDMTVNMQLVGDKYDDLTSGSDSRPRYRVICRSEMIVDVELWGDFNDDAYEVGDTRFHYSHMSKVMDIENISGSDIIPLMHLSHVDSHPLIELVCYSTDAYEDPSYTKQVGYLGEIDRYTYLSRRDLFNIHQQAFWKMLMMPANTKSTTK